MRTQPNPTPESAGFLASLFHRHHHHPERHTVTTDHVSPNTTHPPSRPEALPSNFQDRFKGPVSGTVVIGPDFPDQLEEERCHPHESNPLGTTEPETYSEYAARHQSEFFELVTPNGESIESILNDLKSPTSDKESQTDSEKKRQSILKEGGYVIFSDAYLERHPESSITTITREYQLLSGAKEAVDRYENQEDITDEKKAKLEILKRYIAEVDAQQRPLFRRKNSEVVYGHSTYTS